MVYMKRHASSSADLFFWQFVTDFSNTHRNLKVGEGNLSPEHTSHYIPSFHGGGLDDDEKNLSQSPQRG